MIEAEMASVSREVGAFIESMLGRKDPLFKSAYHLPSHGGKRMRPYLVVKSCEAVGGERVSAIAPAAAVELLHNFTLVHDDIMDNDTMRRGVPTVHVLWGVPTAILAGDLLFAEAFQAILRSALDDRRARAAAAVLADATVSLSIGQFQDMSFEEKDEITENDYLDMISGKTAALFQACAEIGAIAGGGSEDSIKKLGAYGWNLGMAFQIFDDYLGITSNEEALGKPVGNDLREGKKTLIVIRGMQTRSREIIKSLLGSKDATKEQLAALISSLEEDDVLGYVRRKALAYVEEAKKAISTLPDSEPKKSLTQLVEYSIMRKK
ncbi:MAG: Geranylgeranyl diphosphate synthase [Candidatus Methanosuratincola subterraneus]|uniref:Geranylgeranyl diphosphate synthase n=1 Tax=Methanosuratincola subterraneus TaxID=2593994 RepID=A0A3S3RC77_METS7|nr:MAG: Geranylgeranyl diphosphate synthase [Candidatus Methanosuratincola subterraneus]